MSNKNSAFYKALDYLEDKGFYIILFLCVISIGISGYVFFISKSEDSYQPESAVNSDVIVRDNPQQIQDNDIAAGKQFSLQIEENEKISETNNDTLNKQSASEERKTETQSQDIEKAAVKQTERAEKKEEKPQYVRPVNGEVLQSFSGNELVYSQTMEDWRVHSGTDFAAEYGEEVKAFAAGTVEDIYDDEVNGKCVLINHNGGMQTIYTGLAENVSVQKGAKVSTGDIIGTVGDTSILEAGEKEKRFHVELIKDGARDDLEKYLPN